MSGLLWDAAAPERTALHERRATRSWVAGRLRDASGQAVLTGPSLVDKSNIDAIAELAKQGTR